MTARPDEVVAWRIPHPMNPEGLLIHAGKAADAQLAYFGCDDAIPLVPLSALQSANARLAEEQELRLSVEKSWKESMERLAAVLALADEWPRTANARRNAAQGILDPFEDEGLFSEADTLEACAEAIRRAAAGEGDANQGEVK